MPMLLFGVALNLFLGFVVVPCCLWADYRRDAARRRQALVREALAARPGVLVLRGTERPTPRPVRRARG